METIAILPLQVPELDTRWTSPPNGQSGGGVHALGRSELLLRAHHVGARFVLPHDGLVKQPELPFDEW